MDPLIIFKGKNLQSKWLGKESLKDMYYGVSENGWMTTSIFYDWFQKFVCKVEVKSILLLFDGCLTHLSAATVELALAENGPNWKIVIHRIENQAFLFLGVDSVFIIDEIL